ncbi:hypothetical protein B0H19DRAFT_1065621 [Mycena capillaripes]|nr:hypothetical protein B0H19DRAFT_1065621 [Mycena capillaripes]
MQWHLFLSSIFLAVVAHAVSDPVDGAAVDGGNPVALSMRDDAYDIHTTPSPGALGITSRLKPIYGHTTCTRNGFGCSRTCPACLSFRNIESRCAQCDPSRPEKYPCLGNLHCRGPSSVGAISDAFCAECRWDEDCSNGSHCSIAGSCVARRYQTCLNAVCKVHYAKCILPANSPSLAFRGLPGLGNLLGSGLGALSGDVLGSVMSDPAPSARSGSYKTESEGKRQQRYDRVSQVYRRSAQKATVCGWSRQKEEAGYNLGEGGVPVESEREVRPGSGPEADRFAGEETSAEVHLMEAQSPEVPGLLVLELPVEAMHVVEAQTEHDLGLCGPWVYGWMGETKNGRTKQSGCTAGLQNSRMQEPEDRKYAQEKYLLLPVARTVAAAYKSRSKEERNMVVGEERQAGKILIHCQLIDLREKSVAGTAPI